MTPTQPIPGTLLAAFQRFADLSCYWHRNGTPDSLALSELQERHRLECDIPELIKRNTAFADLVSTRMFDAVAKVHAEPPRDDAGQGWRMLAIGEYIELGDEHRSNRTEDWMPVRNCHGSKVMTDDIFMFRRRIAKEPPQDTAGHIRADYQPNAPETAKACDCGASEEVWRMLGPGEEIMEGDEWLKGEDTWLPVSSSIGTPLFRGFEGMCRRRVTPPTPATEPPQP